MRAIPTLSLPSFVLFCFISLPIYAQLPPYQPEQDCFQAIPLCQPIYQQIHAYTGEGIDSTEINPYNSCLLTGELNSVWYTFTVQTSGLLCFSISPQDPQDDYDWALFNLTQAHCEDIYHDVSLQVSCNYYPALPACQGVTGANGNQGACAPASEPCIQVIAGETYVLNVSNYTASNQGYIIDFSASTASILDQLGPDIKEATIGCSREVNVHFSEPVKMESLDATDFVLTNPTGDTISLMIDPTFDLVPGRLTQTLPLYLGRPLDLGLYTLTLSDTILDKCDHPGHIGQLIQFQQSEVPPSLWIGQLRFCRGDSTLIRLNNGANMRTISWHDGSNADSIWVVPTETTPIFVRGETLEGCTFQIDTLITVSDKPSISLIGADTLCAGVVDTFRLISNQENLRYHWWQTAAPYQRNRNGRLPISYDEAGTYGIICRVEQRGCWSDTLIQWLEVLPSPSISLQASEIGCLPDTAITLNVEQPQDSLTYRWEFRHLSSPFAGAQFSLTFDTAGAYPFSVIATNRFACEAAAQDTLSFFPEPPLRIETHAPCVGENMRLNLATVDSLISQWQIRWQIEGLQAQTGPHLHFVPKSTGSLTVSLEILDEYVCTHAYQQEINVLEAIQPRIQWQDSCLDQEGVLKVISPLHRAEYQWSLPHETKTGSEITTALVDPLIPIRLEATYANGCQAQLDTILLASQGASFHMKADSACLGGSTFVQIEESLPALTYHWFGDSTATNFIGSGPFILMDSLEVGTTIWAQSSSTEVCPSELISYTLPIRALPKVEIFLSDQTLEAHTASTRASVISNRQLDKWEWRINDRLISEVAVPELPNPGTGVHQLSLHITDEYGCSAEAHKTLIVNPLPTLHIPTAFSPNNDGINDVFWVNLEAVTQLKWTIYNRWGKPVYVAEGSSIRWNGQSLKGIPVPRGVYTVHLTGQYLTGQLLNQLVSLTLIR